MKVGAIMDKIEFLTFGEIIFCIVVSFIILNLLLFIKLSRECIYPIHIFHSMAEDFYTIFSKQPIMFKGNIYERGTLIKITTIHKKIYEGVFIGFDGKNKICIVNKSNIIINNIKNIKDINLIKY